MRSVPFALAPLLLVTACGGPQTSQANSQSNISNDSRATDNAVGSNLQLRLSLGDAAKVMHERHEGMESIGKSGKAINRELTGTSPNLAIVRAGARQISALAQQSSGWFPEGTGPDAGKTAAKATIWQNPKDFAVKLHNFQVAAAAFDAASSGSDVPRIKVAFTSLEGTCKACHETYRAEKNH